MAKRYYTARAVNPSFDPASLPDLGYARPRKRAPSLSFRKVPAHALQRGMYVRTPPIVLEDWPDAPPVLRVDYWDWVEGETLLHDPDGPSYIDLNAMDYPKTFEVVTGVAGNPSFDPQACCAPCSKGKARNPSPKIRVKVVRDPKNHDVIKATATGRVEGVPVTAKMRPIHIGIEDPNLRNVDENLLVTRSGGGAVPASARKLMVFEILNEIENELRSGARTNPRIRNLARRLSRGETR